MMALTQTDVLLPRLAFYGYRDGWPKFGGFVFDRDTVVKMVPALGFVPFIVINGVMKQTIGADFREAQSWLIYNEVEAWVVETDRRTYRLATGTESNILDAVRRDKRNNCAENKNVPVQLALLPEGVSA